MINIVLFGAPGCGKGTQAQRLKEHYGIDHVSTGEVIRDEIRRGTELRTQHGTVHQRSKLAPDEDRHRRDRELRGSPSTRMPAGVSSTGSRTTVQAEAFDKILAGHGLKVDIMVTSMSRRRSWCAVSLLRGKDSGRADDASEEVIRDGWTFTACRRPWWRSTTLRRAKVRLGERHRNDG